jgi:hypothetical protein
MNRFRKDRPDATAPAPHDDSTPIDVGIKPTNTDETLRSDTAPNYVGPETQDEHLVYGKSHPWDPNMDSSKHYVIEDASNAQDIEKKVEIVEEIGEKSPYAEVNAAVETFDDPTIPANTVRAWILGMTFVTIGSGLNMLFSLRQPAISVGSIVAQLCAYPVGVFMAKTLPKHKFNTFGLRWTLNPGPFNKKEHTLITVMANVSFGGGAAYSTLTIESMRGFVRTKLPTPTTCQYWTPLIDSAV